MGCNANLPTVIAFQSNNVRTNSRRAVGTGVQFMFASISGIYASTTFISKEAPLYRTGLWATLATQFLLLFLVAVMTIYFRHYNKKADTVEGYVIQEDSEFRYTF